VLVVVVAVSGMAVPIMDVVDVIAVGHRLVAAVGTVGVVCVLLGCRVRSVAALVPVTVVPVVGMTIV